MPQSSKRKRRTALERPKNRRNYERHETGRGIKVQLRISPKIAASLQQVVEAGYYLSVNDAIRDFINFAVYIKPWKKRIYGKTPLEEVLKE